MITIPLRQFQLKASEYLTKLPVTLTVYGKPVAIVNTFDVVEMVSGTTDVTKGIPPGKGIAEGPNHTPVLVNIPEHLWDDHNLMPVYKQGEDDQFCAVWHGKGVRNRTYFIKKIRPDGSTETEGWYCRPCINVFKKQDGHLE